jgi:hypothetical protein
MNTRSNKQWSVNECLQLQREYELLGMSVDEIAVKHKRSTRAIMFKLAQEGFADYNALYAQQVAISGNVVIDQEVLETKIDYLVAGVEPKLLEEMRQACERCEQLLKKMRYFMQPPKQTQGKSKSSMSEYCEL